MSARTRRQLDEWLRPHTWYMDSSLMVAMSLRVTARIRHWYSLTFLASSSVSALPSAACCLSRSLRLVISSRISSFSSSCSFLSFNLSSSWFILAWSRSGTGVSDLPANGPGATRPRF